jgi:hypothetical protein
MWTWGGEYFGYRSGDRLFTHRGLQAGRFNGDEVYGSDGSYMGEIKSGNRLITHRGKKGWRRGSFAPVRSSAYARYANYAAYAMYAGYEDFPSAEDFD